MLNIGFLYRFNLGLDRIKGVFGFSELTVCAMDGAARASKDGFTAGQRLKPDTPRIS